MSAPDDVSDIKKAQIKESFIAARGYWRPWTETMLRVCPGFVQQYARYAGYPAHTGPLTERMVELSMRERAPGGASSTWPRSMSSPAAWTAAAT